MMLLDTCCLKISVARKDLTSYNEKGVYLRAGAAGPRLPAHQDIFSNKIQSLSPTSSYSKSVDES